MTAFTRSLVAALALVGASAFIAPSLRNPSRFVKLVSSPTSRKESVVADIFFWVCTGVLYAPKSTKEKNCEKNGLS